MLIVVTLATRRLHTIHHSYAERKIKFLQSNLTEIKQNNDFIGVLRCAELRKRFPVGKGVRGARCAGARCCRDASRRDQQQQGTDASSGTCCRRRFIGLKILQIFILRGSTFFFHWYCLVATTTIDVGDDECEHAVESELDCCCRERTNDDDDDGSKKECATVEGRDDAAVAVAAR